MPGVSFFENMKKAKKLSIVNRKNQLNNTHQDSNNSKLILARALHDLNSPIASIQMLLPKCQSLPKDVINVLEQSVTRINDITMDLLNQFKSKTNNELQNKLKSNSPILISNEILAILDEKKVEYANHQIKFIHNINKKSDLAFVNMDVLAFRRTLSNLINNAVDSFYRNPGIISIILDISRSTIKLTVQDNGVGMPHKIVTKIMNAEAITYAKTNGHGIGFSQIRETVANNNGKLEIESKIGEGTKVSIKFPRVKR